MLRKVLLVCGIVSSLLYVAMTIFGAMQWEGYSPISQAVSELSAIGAPSRPFMVPLLFTYGVLTFAFGFGVWGSVGRQRALRIAAAMLIGYGLVNLVAPFFPMHVRGTAGTSADTGHIVVTSLDVLFMLLSMAFGATAFGKRFRIYSIATILIVLVCGVVAGMDGPRIAADLPTPWHGLMERINIFLTLLWFAALAAGLFRVPRGTQDSLGGGIDPRPSDRLRLEDRDVALWR